MGTKPIIVDLDRLEILAATVENKSDIAERLGASNGFIQERMKSDPAFCAAFERGRAKFEARGDHKIKTDRDGFESGGYTPPPERARIIESLTVSPYQSIRHLCLNTGIDIDRVLAVVEYDDEIEYKFTGGITVYYLKINEPQGRLYNSGYNSFLVKDKEDENIMGKRGKKSSINPAQIEECAAKGMTVKETAAICGLTYWTLKAYVGSNQHSPAAYEAWKRGKERYKEMKAENGFMAQAFASKPELDPVIMPETHREHDKTDTAVYGGDNECKFNEKENMIIQDFNEPENDLLELPEIPITYNARLVNAKIIKVTDCDDCGAKRGQYCVPKDDKFNWLYDALHSSRSHKYLYPSKNILEVETDQRFTHTLDHVVQHGRSRENIERVKARLLADRAPVSAEISPQNGNGAKFSMVESHPTHSKTIKLANGSLKLESDVNIFELSSADRLFIFKLTALMEDFEAGKEV